MSGNTVDASRRALMLGALGGLVLPSAAWAKDLPGKGVGPGDSLPPWTPGLLDIHHIDTGVGNATFILAPDGTTILIDCGATRGGPPSSTSLLPDTSRSAGEWVSRYAARHARAARRNTLDYLVATHVHPDHIGSPREGDRTAPEGYVLTGLSEVDSWMPADVVIDRGFPDYAPVGVIDAPFAANHVAWLQARVAQGRRVEAVRVGASTQLRPRQAGTFNARFVGGNGKVWTGEGEGARDLFPPPSEWTAESRPDENRLSIALVIEYGGFRYYTGGDLAADTHDGAFPWLDVETPIARAAGRVDVAAANHHGYFDANWAGFTRELDADAYVIQGWHATHPDPAVLQRLLNAWSGRNTRDVFITRLDPAAQAVNGRFLKQVKSTQGHVVVRVEPDGSYRMFVTDSRDEQDRIVIATAPRQAKTSASRYRERSVAAAATG